MEPIGLEKIDEENHGAHKPRQRIGRKHHLNFGHKTNHYGNIGNAQQAPGGQHGEHGNHRFSRAPHNAGNAVGKRQQEIKQRFQTRLPGTVIHHLGSSIKQRNQIRP